MLSVLFTRQTQRQRFTLSCTCVSTQKDIEIRGFRFFPSELPVSLAIACISRLLVWGVYTPGETYGCVQLFALTRTFTSLPPFLPSFLSFILSPFLALAFLSCLPLPLAPCLLSFFFLFLLRECRVWENWVEHGYGEERRKRRLALFRRERKRRDAFRSLLDEAVQKGIHQHHPDTPALIETLSQIARSLE